MNIKMTQGAADAEKRDRARMRRSHLRQAALRVAATKARLAAARAELAAQEYEGALDAEFHRGQRAYHLAMSLSELIGEEERARHADAAKAMLSARREVLEPLLERLRARVRACEVELELDRGAS